MVVEETTNAIRSLSDRTLEQVVAVTLLAFAIGALVLLAFASRLSLRLRRLRDEAEQAIDSQGRVKQAHRRLELAATRSATCRAAFPPCSSGSRNTTPTSRSSAAGSRTSCARRSPWSAPRSRTCKLRRCRTRRASTSERAAEGLARLDAILTRMSEATRLESLVREAERERFDAREVLRGCVAATRRSSRRSAFALSLPDGPVMLRGAPDLYAQMLDKLVGNAADFSHRDEPVRIRLDEDEARSP